MHFHEFIDDIPLLVYLIFAIAILVVPIEIGYRGGKYNRGKPDKAQMAPGPRHYGCVPWVAGIYARL